MFNAIISILDFFAPVVLPPRSNAVTNTQVLDALARWFRDNPPSGASPMVLEARAGLKRRLREINGLVAGQEREVALAGPRAPERERK